MAAKARVVSFSVPSGTTSGNVDITDSDLGTIDGGIIFLSGATAADKTISDDSLISVGLFNGTSAERVCSGYGEHGQAITDCARKQNDSAVIEHIASGSAQGRCSVNSLITGGVRLDIDSAFDAAYHGFAILFEGLDDIHVESATNLDGGSTTAPGFKPDFLFVIGTTGGTSIGTNLKFGFGIACRGAADAVSQWGYGIEWQDNLTIVRNWGGVKSGKILLRGAGDGGAYYEQYELSSFDTNGYSFTNVTRSLTGVRILSAKLPTGQQAICGTGTLPSSTGAHNITTTYASGSDDSELFWICADTASTNPTTAPLAVDALSIGAADSQGNEAVVSIHEDYDNADSQAESTFSTADILYTRVGSGALINEADTTNLTGGTATLNVSAGGTADCYGWLAIQAADAGLTVAPSVLSLTDSLPSPAVSPGAVTISMNALAAAESLPNPAVVPSATSIELPALSSSESVPSPGIVPGSSPIAMSELTLADSFPNPAISPGSVSVEVTALSVGETLPSPDVSAGTSVVEVDVLSTDESLPNPAVNPGSVAVDMSVLSSADSVPSPAVVLSGSLIVLPALASSDSIPSPSLSPGSVSIALTALSSSDSLPNLAITAGASLIDVEALSSTDSVPNPSVSVGAATIAIDALSSAESFPAADVVPGSVSVSLAVTSASETIPSPAIQTVVSMGTIVSTESLPDMVLDPGQVIIQLPALASSDSFPHCVILGGDIAEAIAFLVSLDPSIEFSVSIDPKLDFQISAEE